MSLDVNKLIMESVEATLADDPEYQAQKQAQNKPQPQRREQPMQENDYNPLATITASAISAGLGALAMTNRIRNLQEGVSEHLKKHWGKYAGAAALLGGAAAGYINRDKLEDMAAEHGGSGVRRLLKRETNEDRVEDISKLGKAKVSKYADEGESYAKKKFNEAGKKVEGKYNEAKSYIKDKYNEANKSPELAKHLDQVRETLREKK